MEKKKNDPGVFVRLRREHQMLTKPSGKELAKGTFFTFGTAIASAFVISAFDTCFSALIELFL